MRFLTRLVVSSLAVIFTSFILPGVHIKDALTAVMVAFVLSLLNAVIKPILVVLTIPVTIFSFGLFLLVINALIILLAARIVPGFSVDGFWTALFFSMLLSLITSIMEALSKQERQS
ncbi:MAG: phage holin family protein [Bacteroidota bacterium]